MAQNTPPYPWDPLPSLNLYTADGTNYYFDDRNYDYSAGADNETLGVIVRGGYFQPDDSGPPGTGSGGTGSGGGATVTYSPINFDDFSCPDNCGVVISNVYGAGEVVVGITNGVPGVVYNLLTNAVLGSTTGWNVQQSITATATATVTWGDPISTSVSSNLFFIAQVAWPTLLWKTTLPFFGDNFGVGIDSSPALSLDGNHVYVLSTGNALFSINAATGAIEFSNVLTTEGGENSPSPAIATNGDIIVGSTDGFLFSFSTNLTTNWSTNLALFSLPASVFATPAVTAGNNIYVGTDDNDQTDVGSTGFFSFTGSNQNWAFFPQGLNEDSADVESSAAVGQDGTIYFLAEDFRLYALYPDGNVKWFLPIPGDTEVDSSPGIGPDGTIYVGSDSPYLYAVSPDGSLKWTFHAPTTNEEDEVIYSSPVIDSDGTVYVGEGFGSFITDINFNVSSNTQGGIFAVNNGQLVWAFTNVSGSVVGSMALAADGTVYAGAASSNHTFGILYAITNGAQKWAFQTSNDIVSSPIICNDGSVIITCEDSNVYKIAGCSPVAESPWPLFHHDLQHTGSLAVTNPPQIDCEPPFPNNSELANGVPPFIFSVVGPTNSTWSVLASTNLINWTNFETNINLGLTGMDQFTDFLSSGTSSVFYYLSSNGCCSRVIGFITFTLSPGTNLIANPFCEIDDFASVPNVEPAFAPMNTVATLFPGQFSNNQNFPEFQPGTNFIGWDGHGYVTNTSASGPTWLPNGDVSLLPGTGVILDMGTNSGSQPIWFTGLVPESVTNQIVPGTNFLGSALPVAGGISTVLGYTNATVGDWLQKWDPTNGIFITYTNNGGTNWYRSGTPNEPYIGLCEGFILFSDVATNRVWRQSFSPCGSN